MFSDLHIHTTASDGLYSPRDIVERAHKMGLRLIAITDHDTLEGIEEALSVAKELGDMTVIPGVENSTKYHGKTTVHLLAYFPNGEVADEYREFLKHKAEEREERLDKIILALEKSGVHIEKKEVKALADGVIGRPHIAQVLVNHGVVGSVTEAFEKWLTPGKPGYACMPPVETSDIIAMVKRLGGMTSVAHPYQTKCSLDELKSMFLELKAAGLDAVECYHSDHDKIDTEDLLALVSEVGLKISGGSDFHGIVDHNIYLGMSNKPSELRITHSQAKELFGLKD